MLPIVYVTGQIRYSSHAREKQNTRENTFPAYASRVYSLDSFWPGTFRCQRDVIAHRRAVKRFGRVRR